MTELSSKQKAHLRGLGQRLDAVASVGKAGLSEPVVAGIQMLLARHELIKVHIPAGAKPERQETAQQLADAAGAQLVGLVGRMVVLYRENPELDKEKRIPLE